MLFAHVESLDAYEAWMPVVHSVDAEATDPGSPPAWTVELRTNVGPLARSKRLRMERTEHVTDRRAVFERKENDGRTHSSWVLRADLAPSDDTTSPTLNRATTTTSATAATSTTLTMTLSYGGSLWTGAVLQRSLDEQVRRGSEALLDLVTSE